MARRSFVDGADTEADVVRDLVITKTSGMWMSDQYPEPNLPDEAMVLCSDVLPGMMKKRDGQSAYFASLGIASGITGMHSFQRHTATPEILYSYNGSVYKNIANTLIEGAMTNNNFEFCTYKDVAYYVNGDNGLHSYNGTPPGAAVTAYTASGSEPANFLSDATSEVHNSKYIAVHEQVIYLGGPPNIPYRLYRSDEVQGPTYIHNYIDVISPRGGKIVGLKPFNGVLIVLKDDSIYAADGLIGTHDFKLRTLHAGIGCFSGRSAVEVPGLGLVFMGSDGHFYALRPEYVQGENVPLFKLSAHISNIIPNVYWSYPTKPCAFVAGNIYHCVVYLTTDFTGIELMFDSTRVETLPNDPLSLFVPWSYSGGQAFGAFATHFDGTNVLSLGGWSSEGKVWKLDDSASASAGGGVLVTKDMHFGFPERSKQLLDLYILARQESTAASTITTVVAADDGSWATLDTVTTTAATPTYTPAPLGISPYKYSEFRVPVNLNGTRFRFQIYGAGSKPMTIAQLKFRFKIEGAR